MERARYSCWATVIGQIDRLPGEIILELEQTEIKERFDCDAGWEQYAETLPPRIQDFQILVTVTDQGIAGHWFSLGIVDGTNGAFLLLPEQ